MGEVRHVVRELSTPAGVAAGRRIALVELASEGHWPRRRERERVVVQRDFDRHDAVGADQWRGALREAILYLERDEMGCQVLVEPLVDGRIRMRLVDRFIQPDRVAAQILADETFDADALGSTEEVAARVADLRARADEINDRRSLDEALELAAADEVAQERRTAIEMARQLADAVTAIE